MFEVLIVLLAATIGGLGFLALLSVRVAREYERAVVFRLGRLHGVRGPGLYFLVPLLEWQRTLDLRTVTVDVPPQDVITRDSVTVSVDAVLYYQVVSPTQAITAVADYRTAVHLAALTTLRKVLGQHELDDLLKSRDSINRTLQELLAHMAGPWGLQVLAVETKAVEIPESMQRAMAKEAEAVREKRSRLIKAEAEEEASAKLSAASQRILENPAALELRRLQMIAEIGAEQNTTTIILLPSDFVMMARGIAQSFGAAAAKA